MRLHQERRGAGEPLVLVMGMSGPRHVWGDAFLDALSADFELLLLDNRGTGDSPRAEEPFSIADLAADVAEAMDEAGIERAHVLGVSMGGMVAQELALRHPDRVRTLTLACTWPGGPRATRTSADVWRALADAMASGDRERALRTMWEANVSAGFARDEEQYAAFRERALRHPVAVAVIAMQFQAVAAHDTSDRLGRISAPTLVVHGTEDRMLPVANAGLIAEAVPGARLEILEGAGHLLWLERPARVAELVRAHATAAEPAQ